MLFQGHGSHWVEKEVLWVTAGEVFARRTHGELIA